MQCRRILDGRNRNIVVAAIFDFMTVKDCSKNSNPYGRCEGERKKGGGEGEKKIRLPDIIVLLGNSIRWQTELLIGAA